MPSCLAVHQPEQRNIYLLKLPQLGRATTEYIQTEERMKCPCSMSQREEACGDKGGDGAWVQRRDGVSWGRGMGIF